MSHPTGDTAPDQVARLLALAVFPVETVPEAEALGQVPIKALPRTTERWLEAQRPALPAPVRSLVDSIGVKLETLSPQLSALQAVPLPASVPADLLGRRADISAARWRVEAATSDVASAGEKRTGRAR